MVGLPENTNDAIGDIRAAVKKAAEKSRKRNRAYLAGALIVVLAAAAILVAVFYYTPEPVELPKPDLCGNLVQDEGERGIDCGGACFAECLETDNPAYTAPSSVYDVAVDKLDRIYVVDKERDRLLVFSPELGYLRNIGETNVAPGGSSNSQFAKPLAVAVSPFDGKVFVSDRFNSRIQVFDSGLNYLKTIGEKAYGIHGRFAGLCISKDNRLLAVGEAANTLYFIGDSSLENEVSGFNEPYGCAVSRDGRIFLADSKNQAVKVFSTSLEKIAQIGGKAGKGNNEFKWPTGVALDSQGNIYVADSENSRVQIFGPDYSFKKTLSGVFLKPTKVAIDSKGRIIVGDTGKNKVFVFNPDFTQAGTIDGIGWERYGSLYFMPRYIATMPDGRVLVSSEANQRIVVLGSDLSFIGILGGEQGNGDYQFFNPRDLIADGKGRVYVADKDNHRVQVFDSSLKYVMTIGKGRGAGPGEFDDVRSVAVDSTGRIFAVDMGNSRVQVFDPQGNYLAEIDSSGEHVFKEPVPITIDSEDNIYVANSKAPKIFMFDKDLKYVKTIDAGSDIIEMEGGIKIDSKGRLVLSDIEGHMVRMIDLATGEKVKTIGGQGLDPGRFNWPHGIAIAKNGNILVVDQDNYRVQVFDSELNYLTQVNGGSDHMIETPE